jgi:hypothetical protein
MKAVGRPKKINKDVASKLEEAFALGCSDREACLFANISEQTLYTYQKDNTQFKERKDLLKTNPVLKARMTVVQSLEHDPNLAFKYLERRCKEEFDPKYKQEELAKDRASQDDLTIEESEKLENTMNLI